MSPAYTAADLLAALRRRYERPAYLLVDEVEVVAEKEDAATSRRLDAVAVGLWHSTGQLVDGFELKVARGDWLAELARPGKAEAGFARTHRWWLVAPEDVVRAGELPAGWGWLAPPKQRKAETFALRVKVHPAMREHPPRFGYGWWLRVFQRAVSAEFHAEAMEQVRRAARARGRAEAEEEHARRRVGELTATQQRLVADGQRLQEFEAATGLRLNEYGAQEQIEAVNVLQSLLSGRLSKWTFEHAIVDLFKSVKELRRVAHELRKLRTGALRAGKADAQARRAAPPIAAPPAPAQPPAPRRL